MTNCGSSFCKLGYTCDLTVVCFFSHYLSFFWFILLPKAQINFPKHKLISEPRIISQSPNQFLYAQTNFSKHKSKRTGRYHLEDQRELRKTLLARMFCRRITHFWEGYGRPVSTFLQNVTLFFALLETLSLLNIMGTKYIKKIDRTTQEQDFSRGCLTQILKGNWLHTSNWVTENMAAV